MQRISVALFSVYFASASLLLGSLEALADEPVRRDILALYDATEEPELATSRLHRFAEMPLNHMGFILRYRDVNQPLPDVAEMQDYAGVITWFSDPLKNPAPYLAWAYSVVQKGTKYVVFGDPGADPASVFTPAVNAFLGAIGITYEGHYVDPTYGTRVVHRDKMIGFEHDLDPSLPPYAVTVAAKPDVTPLIEVKAPERQGRRHSVLAAVSPRGGYVAFGWEFYHERPVVNRGQWIIDPFEFFRLAFGSPEFPIPDVTTVSGRRLYFSHVDGDGWNNLTTLGQRFRGRLSSDVMLEELIAPYPDLPVTIGLISGDVDPRLGGSPEAEDIARRIFALPQVEVGSHTYTHPFAWGFYETYDRARELKLMTMQDNPDRGLRSYLKQFSSALGMAHHGHGDLVSGSADLPRAFLRDPFDLSQEISGSLKVATGLAPPGKATAVIQWSGDTSPFEAAIKASRQAGVVNINGGDSRFDSIFPSIAYVPPIGKPVGGERQIYAVNSNENTYTDGWTKDYAGQAQLTQTLDNTEVPRRLKGFNLYYHVYSAERQASLDALKGLLKIAHEARITPITTSHYAAMADGFYTTKITSLGADVWSITDRGATETVRFDRADDKDVDLERSRGVLGSNRHAGSLYVAFDSSVPDAVVALRALRTGAERASRPSLVESRWRVFQLERRPCDNRYTAQGFGAGQFRWEGMEKKSHYRIAARVDGEEVWTTKVVTDGEGKLDYNVPVKAFEPIQISVVCISQTGVE